MPGPGKLHGRGRRAWQELRSLLPRARHSPAVATGEGQRLVILFVASFFTLVLLAGWSYLTWRDYRETQRAAEQSTASYALALEEHARRSFDSAYLAIARLVDRMDRSDPWAWAESQDAWRMAKTLSTELPQIGGITMIDAAGRVRMSTAAYPSPAVNVSDRDYFAAHAVRGETRHLGPLLLERSTGKPVFTLGMRIADARGGFAGAIVAWMDVGYFRQFYRSLDLGARSSVSLLRDDGRFVVREPMRLTHVDMNVSGSRLFSEQLPRRPTGVFEARSPFDQVERLIAFRRSRDYPIVVAAGRSLDAIREPVWRRGLLSAVAVGFFLAIVWGSVRVQLLALERERLSREALAESRDFTDSILDSVRSHIAILDQHGRILRTNRPWRDFARANGLVENPVGWTYLEVSRRSGMREADEAVAGIAAVTEGACANFDMEYACESSDEKRWFAMHVTPLRGKSGQVVVSHENITHLKEVEEALRRLATTDSLTGLLNRRMLVEHGEEAFARARRYTEALALIMIDCDHFKRINDRYGHAVGDSVLVSLADTIRACIRDTDHAGRLGGEEFLVILPNTTREGAVQLALRMRDAVRNALVAYDGMHVSFTVSLGVSSTVTAVASFDELLRAADEALYRAKDRGRDRVEVS